MARKRKQNPDTKKRQSAARRKQETPEQRALRLEKCRVRAALKRASETDEERAARLARDRYRIYSARYTLKKKARAFNLQYARNQSSSNCSHNSNLPDMSKNEKAAYRAYILLETQRAAAARSAADRRNRETFEQRTARLEKCRIRSAVSRACEDEDTRAVRLARQRIRTNSARLKQRLTEVESQQANSQRTSANINNIYYSGKTLVQSFKQNPYCSYSSLAVKEFSNQLIQQFHQLHLAYNLNTHLGLQATANQSQPAFNPSNIWPTFDHLDLVLGNPFISPDEQKGETKDDESDLEYDTSKSDIVVECEVTIEEDNSSLINQVFIKGEPAEEEKPFFDCEPTTEEDNSVINQLFTKKEPAEEEKPLFDCEPTTVKQEVMNTKENLSDDSLPTKVS